MPTVAHKNLTGTDLHEPKGVAAATINKVYVSNGAGSGTWQKLTASQLETTGNPFGAQLLHVRDQQSSGTAGGAFNNGDWRTRVLNTSVTNEITSATLSANRISLPSGTYFIKAIAPAFRCDLHQARLYNITDTSLILTGTTASADEGGNGFSHSIVQGRFTLGGTKSLELQHRCSTTRGTNGLGVACSFGTEVYSEVMIWKIA
jgi:hypothetical protein